MHLSSLSRPASYIRWWGFRLRWYGLALALSALALSLMLLLEPLIEPEIFLLFVAAVAISAMYGGLGPGLAATVLSAVACDFFFLPPLNTLLGGTEETLRISVFVSVGLIMSWLAEVHKRDEQRLRTRNEEPPDPWRCEAVGDNHFLIDADGNEIARFSAERPARLCAAAPKLLEAAKETWDELSEYLAPWAERLAAQLGEAIKKAEGQEE